MKKIIALSLSSALSLSLLAGCSQPTQSNATPAPQPKEVTFEDTVAWDGRYDVVVIGFGGAGSVAAKTAAEEGAAVLLLEKAPEGSEGGDIRYSGQTFTFGNNDYESTATYFRTILGSHTLSDEVFEVFCRNVTNIDRLVADMFDLNINEITDASTFGNQGSTGCEYPEYPGSDAITLMAAHSTGNNDGYLWSLMRDSVVRNSDIDVWFASPATHLIQDPGNKAIIGVQVERNGKTLNIRADNGVILACGGFSANADMVETYLGLTDATPVGSIYNTGDGITMTQEVGAQLCHMDSYLGVGTTMGAIGLIEERVQHYITYMPPCTTGSSLLVSGTGDRFMDESAPLRHGLTYAGDIWKNPDYPDNMYLILGPENYQTALAYNAIPSDYAYTYSGTTLEELAQAAGMIPETLAQTIENFNRSANNGEDLEFGRSAGTMTAFPAQGPYYAIKVGPTVLITRGGALRNENAEVLGTNGAPIPNLYSAGEFGSVISLQYQPGACIAECIIFGQIAGRNAAKAKNYTSTVISEVESNITFTPGTESDLKASDYSNVTLGENEYLGVGAGGMGGDIALKVTIVDGEIKAIEVVEEHETPDRFAGVKDTMIPAIIAANSTEVDGIASATLSSNAVKAAVEDALNHAK